MAEPRVEPLDFHGRAALRLHAADGAQATVLLHGAHLVSWRPADGRGGAGEEQLFLSERAVYADGQAVRGGVPVIFPQFEKRGALPRHGLARTRNWAVAKQAQQADHATLVLRLTDDESTHAHWPHAFTAELTISVGGSRLDIELAAENTGEQPFSFTAALHTYLRIADLAHARLAGLSGMTYFDSTTGVEQLETAQTLAIEGEVDRIYFGAPQTLALREPGRTLLIQSQQFDDAVVWNPGPEKCAALADMPEDGWRNMLCVEAACIGHPITLAPGEEWAGRQTLRIPD